MLPLSKPYNCLADSAHQQPAILQNLFKEVMPKTDHSCPELFA